MPIISEGKEVSKPGTKFRALGFYDSEKLWHMEERGSGN